MMEVKHSPSSQMDFRTATNGLPIEDEDEEMNTLLGTSSVTKTSCAPKSIQNGNTTKYDHLEDGMEIDLLDDDMDDELNTSVESSEKKKENEETESKKAELDLFDLDLEATPMASVVKVTNGDVTDSSTTSVRDPGDDLDTLLSKINDLVEDCMEPKTGEQTTATDVVDQLVDAEAEDILENKEKESLESVSDDTHDKERVEEEVVVEKDQETVSSEVEKESAMDEVLEEEVVEKQVEQCSAEVNKAEDAVEVAAEEEVEEKNSEEQIAEEELDNDKTSNDLEEDLIEENGVDVTEAELELEEEKISTEPEGLEKEIEAEEVSEVEVAANESAEEIVEEAVATETVEELVEQEEVVDDIPVECMDVEEGDIVCLDSPMETEKDEKDEEKLGCQEKIDESSRGISEAEAKETEEEVKESTTEEEIPVPSKDLTDAEASPVKEGDADDDIMLIEDEDDAVPDDASSEKDNKSTENEECKKFSKDKDVEISSKSEEAHEEKTENKSPSRTNEDDDDDIVFLDDSLEEPKEKQNEEGPTEDASPNVDRIEAVEEVKEGSCEQEKEEGEEVKGTETEKSLQDKQEGISERENPELTQIVSSETTENSSPEKSTDKSDTKTTENEEVPSVTSSSALCDNDVISLDDDDEDLPAAALTKDAIAQSSEIQNRKTSDLLSADNSDNARDGSDEKSELKDNTPKPPTPQLASETNSNSSNNLLKESSVIGREESQNEQPPPAKRIRLSQDGGSTSHEDANSKLVDDDDVMEVVSNEENEGNKSLKRVHSSSELLQKPDLKKPKTDIDSEAAKDDEKNSNLLEEIIPEPVKDEKKELKKPIEPVTPLPLYPPPNFDGPKVDLSLDFLRRFKKTIHKMNKCDLEELVLQKIVEAIVHKSEFSEMRELIEKQEKIISGHRSKITELNKQFRDLEMVHNRVLKDLETKNSQFIMPVKITRAVGLQVYFPNKKYDQPMTSIPAAPGPSSQARSASTSSSTSSVADRAVPPTAVSNTNSIQSSLGAIPGGIASQNHQQQQQPQRRGCVQKLTPMRPDGPRSQMQSQRGAAAGVVSSSTSTSMATKETSPKIWNRVVTPKTRLPTAPMVNIASHDPNKKLPVLHPQPTEAERAKAQLMNQAVAMKKTSGVLKSFPPSKRIPKSWQADQQPNSPMTQRSSPTMSSSSTPSSMASPLSSPLPNTPAATKPPTRSVIDLTDEDEMSSASSSRNPNVQATAQKAANSVAGSRVGPYKVSVIPAAQLQQQQPRPNPQKSALQRSSSQLASKPNGSAANTLDRTLAAPLPAQRYRHPAPLPNQPIHSSNPLWKLPPARPTIRISNLDSGIVISWTIEDTAKEKYAESTSYQIYAYQETSGPPMVESWRHVGDVKAMLLPMAVTLTQFQEGQRYYFAVRAVDAHNRCGPFSFAKTWS